MSNLAHQIVSRHADHPPGWTRGLTFIQLGKLDPSKTLPIQKAFIAESDLRFDWLVDVIEQAIVDRDVFGLGVGMQALALTTPAQVVAKLPPRAFDFPRSAEKVNSFMEWLGDQERAGILEITRRPGAIRGLEQAWSDTYIQHAYQQGIARARDELQAAGYEVPTYRSDKVQDVQVAFNQPIHADRVGLAYTRTFTGLKGITAAMDTQISNVLADGLAAGLGPKQIAKNLRATITGEGLGDLGITDKIGRFIPAKRRAQMLARTEVMRAHHSANMGEYRQAQAMGIKLVAEWETGAAPCDICAGYASKKYWELDDIESLIPVHPHCMCVAVPLPLDFIKGEKPTAEGEKQIVTPQPVREPISIEWVKEAELSDDFKKLAKSAIEQMPTGFRNSLAPVVKYKFGPYLTDIDPSLKGVRPRGWPADSTWDNAEGCYSPHESTAKVSEKCLNLWTKNVETNDRFDYVLYHESGHGFDDVLNKASRGDAFKSVWEADIKAMSADSSTQMQYFIQGNSIAGQEEAFAEGIATVLEEHLPTQYHKTYSLRSASNRFKTYFPKTTEFIRNLSVFAKNPTVLSLVIMALLDKQRVGREGLSKKESKPKKKKATAGGPMLGLFYVSVWNDGRVEIRARMEEPGTIGDYGCEIKRGEQFYDQTYESLRRSGGGAYRVVGDKFVKVEDKEAQR